jgi:hypothetical protein
VAVHRIPTRCSPGWRRLVIDSPGYEDLNFCGPLWARPPLADCHATGDPSDKPTLRLSGPPRVLRRPHPHGRYDVARRHRRTSLRSVRRLRHAATRVGPGRSAAQLLAGTNAHLDDQPNAGATPSRHAESRPARVRHWSVRSARPTGCRAARTARGQPCRGSRHGIRRPAHRAAGPPPQLGLLSASPAPQPDRRH